MKNEIGTVISSFNGPSPSEFEFVVKDINTDLPIKKDQFITVKTEEGLLVARVENLKKTNRYFSRAESVKEYQKNGNPLSSIFPTEQWEFLAGTAMGLGVLNKGVHRASFPPSPGEKVSLADERTLKQFLGFEDNGINLGKIAHHNLEAKLNLTKLFQKHVAILAMSGAGKSYLTSVLIEELLSRSNKKGRLGLVIIDTHGEYTSFAENMPGNDDYHKHVKIIRGRDIKIRVSSLNAYTIAGFLPKMSSAQVRDLSRIINEVRQNTKEFDLDYLIDIIRADELMKDNSKVALIGWLNDLNRTNLFGKTGYPVFEGLVKPGNATLVDVSDLINLRAKQIIVAYFSRQLFNLRRKGTIPPYVEIIEEAHNFVPEGTKGENAISRSIIETIAREGRKFYASLCLISQRPIQLSTTALSQCNTHIILRVTNPYDLDHIGKSSEGITKETLNTISSLRVGEALLVGEAVHYPVFIKVRRRNSAEPKHALDLEAAASLYESEVHTKLEDMDAFM